MKKSTLSIVIILVLVVAGIMWFNRNPASDVVGGQNPDGTPPSVSETTKVSSSLSEYQNAELGFSVKYPSAWQAEDMNAGVQFIVPVGKDQVTTIASLKAVILVSSGTCTFPPIPTGVKDRGTIKVGENTLNTISMANSVQGRNYYNRMYSYQKGEVCYMFSFGSITLSPESKNLTGSNLTQAENNNKAIMETAESAFVEMVKSFKFITGPAGVDETKASPIKNN